MRATAWSNDRQTTLPEILAAAVDRWPDRPSFDFLGETMSYAEVDHGSNRIAHGLRALGVAKGDTVATMLDNSLDPILLLYAITKLGAIAVPINSSFRGEFLRHQLDDSGAAIVIAEGDYAERILKVADQLPALKLLVFRGDPPSASGRIERIPLDALQAESEDPIDADIGPSDIAMLIYTSGTTGPSKGCMIPHNYLCNVGRLNVHVADLDDNDVFWTPLPLFHLGGINGVLVAAPVCGARVALAPRFSLSGFWPEIERTGATVVGIIGSMIALIAGGPDCEAAQRCHGQIRLAKGAPFPEATRRIWRERFGVRECGAPGYGMTEMTMITVCKASDPSPQGTSGRRFEDYDVRIIDDRGFECPPGIPGEIVARPMRPNIMFKGYWRRPEATAAAWADLWFHTGDIGSIDADGFFTFVDRKKDYLRRGGENISSFEMETAFRQHPDIDDVAVHAVPSELGEDEVKVTAVLKSGAGLAEEDLCRWSIDRVPHFAVPRFVEFRSDLPRNPVGRVLKYQLRDEGVTASTWDRAASGIVVRRR